MNIKTLKDITELEGKKVILRADLNVPLSKEDNSIQDDKRIQAVLPTVKYLQERGARIIMISHLGRPKGEVVENLRLGPIAERLGELLNTEVKHTHEIFSEDVKAKVDKLQDGEILMLENIRFDAREKKCDREFSKQIASLGEIFVNDAFGTAHREHCSITGLSEFLPAYAGLLIEKEVEMLSKALKAGQKPITIILGGAKIDTKIGIIEKFIDIADNILVGGGIANTFIYAQGLSVGESLCQVDKANLAQELIQKAKAAGKEIIIPEDVVVANEIEGEAKNVDINEVEGEFKIFDIGPKTQEKFTRIIAESKTVIWNGPVGLYEYENFSAGTKSIVEAIAANTATMSILGGGDTCDAIKRFGADPKAFSHVSTGGGASLKFLEGSKLPGLEVLKVTVR